MYKSTPEKNELLYLFYKQYYFVGLQEEDGNKSCPGTSLQRRLVSFQLQLLGSVRAEVCIYLVKGLTNKLNWKTMHHTLICLFF